MVHSDSFEINILSLIGRGGGGGFGGGCCGFIL
jgi:hypothetical protein